MTCENLVSFIVFEVALRTKHGDTRAVVWLARSLLDCAVLKQYSEQELALMFFLQVGVPPELGLRRETKWCDLVGLHGAFPIAQKLSELTGWPHDRQHVCKALRELGVRTVCATHAPCGGPPVTSGGCVRRCTVLTQLRGWQKPRKSYVHVRAAARPAVWEEGRAPLFQSLLVSYTAHFFMLHTSACFATRF